MDISLTDVKPETIEAGCAVLTGNILFDLIYNRRRDKVVLYLYCSKARKSIDGNETSQKRESSAYQLNHKINNH